MTADTIVKTTKGVLVEFIKDMATRISNHNGNESILVEVDDDLLHPIHYNKQVYDTYTTEYYTESRTISEIGVEEDEWYIVLWDENGEDETIALDEEIDLDNLVRIANGLEYSYNTTYDKG